MKYNRRDIMRDAHRRRKETGSPMGECLKAAWANAKYRPAAIAPQRLPIEALVKDTWALAKKLKSSRIEVAARVHVDFGLRITPKGESPMAYVMSKEVAGGFNRDAR